MFPWNLFKESMDPLKPFNEKEFQSSLEKWMKNMVSDLPSMFQIAPNKDVSAEKKSLNEQVFETHEFVYIRIPIDDANVLKDLKIYYSINKCFINGVFSEEHPYIIILPVTVKKKGARAVFKDGILEIRIPKNIDWQYSEIDIDTYI
ncbi:Hsp20/alpha crystallin family protein [Fervidibacillus halotolerans]|uniref:Hsp20/alpha crystallin family protein n=1 Tax=Fervidibacillus halotolerans TaxID=2980027 RepID=A0A9E8RYX6_9BACI|nr:Hsp20/alpha crystallin family protein [Fervidibacillus halotolerans]WAA13291.1 Hsp20/alpha crystallin family protein [Fervidibacillus halotolerans]